MKKRILVVDDSTTIRKVVTGILERHGYEAVAAPDAQVALETLRYEGTTFDLVLVDFVMPKMNGFQFCRELRKTELGQTLPVVLMSAKSDKIREKFVLQTGAVDAITKPFDAQALVTLIEHALDKIARGDVPDTQASPPIESGSEHPSHPPLGDDAAPTIALHGDLRAVPLGAILQLAQMESVTGVLVVSSDVSEIRIVLNKGLVDRVGSRGARDEFRLGRFIIEAGLATSQEIEKLLASLRGSADDSDAMAQKPRLGDVLLQSGKVTEAQLVTAISRQSSELIYEALRWQRGRFELRTQLEPRDQKEPRLGLPVASVVMEGFRRVDEWRLIEKKLGNFDEGLVPDPVAIKALGDKQMTKEEQTVLDAIGPGRTLREVITESHMSSFDACKIVCQFLEARLVRRQATA